MEGRKGEMGEGGRIERKFTFVCLMSDALLPLDTATGGLLSLRGVPIN